MESFTNNIHRELIERCREGDKKAFRSIYELYSKAMYSISLRLTGDKHDAQDILQEAFTAAFLRMKEFRFESTFGAWLKRIVIYKCIDFHNKRKRKYEYIEQIGNEKHWEPEHEINENEAQLISDRIKKAIQTLPDGSRTIFSLYLLEGYDHTEIATIMNISESTSKTQYLRARLKVKEYLINEYGYEKR